MRYKAEEIVDWSIQETVSSCLNKNNPSWLKEGDISPSNFDVQHKANPRQSRLWPGGIIDFISDPNLSPGHKLSLARSILHWELHTCLTFNNQTGRREFSKKYDHILFTGRQNGCFSRVGRIGGRQIINLGEGCDRDAVIIHEIGHAIGLHHEQSRTDRNDFVTVLTSNINPNFDFNFNRRVTNNFHVPYDYTSIMHYTANAFSIEPFKKNTLRSANPFYQYLMGSSRTLSFYDKKLVNLLYACGESCGDIICRNNGYLDNNCECKCRIGYFGARCQLGNPPESPVCGGVIEEPGTIQTPGYPRRSRFREGRSCVYHIKAPAGHQIRVFFMDFNYFRRIKKLCILEHVEVRLNSLHSEGKFYCGSELMRKTLESEGDEMVVMINSYFGTAIINRGMRANIHFVSNVRMNMVPNLPPPPIETKDVMRRIIIFLAPSATTQTTTTASTIETITTAAVTLPVSTSIMEETMTSTTATFMTSTTTASTTEITTPTTITPLTATTEATTTTYTPEATTPTTMPTTTTTSTTTESTPLTTTTEATTMTSTPEAKTPTTTTTITTPSSTTTSTKTESTPLTTTTEATTPTTMPTTTTTSTTTESTPLTTTTEAITTTSTPEAKTPTTTTTSTTTESTPLTTTTKATTTTSTPEATTPTTMTSTATTSTTTESIPSTATIEATTPTITTPPTTTTVTTPSTTTSKAKPLVKASIEIDICASGGILQTKLIKGESIYITTPNYGEGPYPNNRLCKVKLRTSSKNYILLEIENLIIEKQRRCRYDYLRISTSRKVLKSYCGSLSMVKKSFPYMKLFLEFRSDYSNPMKGFRIKFTAVSRKKKII